MSFIVLLIGLLHSNISKDQILFSDKEHTRNLIDQGFGNTKKEYAKLEIWYVDQLV